jgi:hypothetical protein
MLGVDCPDAAALSTRLRKAIDNSRKKNYHGGNAINELPTLNEQTKSYLFREPQPDVYYDVETKLFTVQENDDFWQRAVMQRYPWVGYEFKTIHKNHTPGSLALMSDNRTMYKHSNQQEVLKSKIALTNTSQHWLLDQVQEQTVQSDYSADFSWRKLFHKLCFEELLDNFTKFCDFETLYKYINVMGSEILVLRLKILNKLKLKSNHYYVMVVVGRLKALQTLKLHQPMDR